MNDLITTTNLRSPTAQVQRELNPAATEFFNDLASCVEHLQRQPGDRDEMMTQITAKYNQCREIVLGYSVIAIGPGVALFAAPRDVAIQDSWNAFRSDLSLGAGGERKSQAGFQKILATASLSARQSRESKARSDIAAKSRLNWKNRLAYGWRLRMRWLKHS
jgi:hypothetical protein